MTTLRPYAAGLLAIILLGSGCSQDVLLGVLPAGDGGRAATGGVAGSDGSGAEADAGAGGATGGTSGTAGVAATAGAAGGVFCRPGAAACDNCRDDDGDGLTDAADPDCTGPFDDDEATLGLGSILAPGCAFAPAGERCAKWTPVGCDCHGCCRVGSTGRRVLLTDGCTADTLQDPQSCPTCQLDDACLRDCGNCLTPTCDPCGVCFAEGVIGATCMVGDATRCPTDQAECDPARPCPETAYCVSGCCVPR